MNQWEIKQIIDVVSKGVNSLLMASEKMPPAEELKKLSSVLCGIYVEMIANLKKTPTKHFDFEGAERAAKAQKEQERIIEQSQMEDVQRSEAENL